MVKPKPVRCRNCGRRFNVTPLRKDYACGDCDDIDDGDGD